MILGIDPGKHTGLAWVEKSKIYSTSQCDEKQSESVEAFAHRIYRAGYSYTGRTDCVVAIERPVIYDKTPYRTTDVLDLMYLVGLIVGHFHKHNVLRFTPAEWKGQVPKKIHNQRVRDTVIGAKDIKSDHILDATGIALFAETRKRL